MAKISVEEILGKPWVEGSSDPAVGLDCAGVVRWALERLGVPPAELPEFPKANGHKVDPAEVKRCADLWVELPLSGRMRVGDVLTAAPERGTNAPHLCIIIQDSPCMVASSVERYGVVTMSATRVPNVTGVYRWPAAAKLVGAPA